MIMQPPCVKVHQLTRSAFFQLAQTPFLSNADQIQRAVADRKAGHYRLVAEVATDDLDLAYQLTNSIDCSWWENPGVVQHFEGEGCRSTSVGDVLEKSDGALYVVCTFGFAAMPVT